MVYKNDIKNILWAYFNSNDLGNIDVPKSMEASNIPYFFSRLF